MANAFHRSIIIFSLIQAAGLLRGLDRLQALANIPNYYSRGKGRGGWHKTSGIGQHWKCNNGGTDRPHQNRAEMIRRRRQMVERTHGYPIAPVSPTQLT